MFCVAHSLIFCVVGFDDDDDENEEEKKNKNEMKVSSFIHSLPPLGTSLSFLLYNISLFELFKS